MPKNKSARRYDHNGWFEVRDNPLSVAGVHMYRGAGISPDLDPDKLYPVLTPPEELGDPECIESFKLVPWTDNHPSSLMGDGANGTIPAESKDIQGVVGEKIYFDQDDGVLRGNIKLFSKAHAERLAQGKRELSLGYRCRYEPSRGAWNGQPYEFVKREIRGNHMSSVDEGRMGEEIAVLDMAAMKFTVDSAEVKKMKVSNTLRETANRLLQYAMDQEEGEGGGGDDLKKLTVLLKKIAPAIQEISTLQDLMAGAEVAEEVEGEPDEPDMVDIVSEDESVEEEQETEDEEEKEDTLDTEEEEVKDECAKKEGMDEDDKKKGVITMDRDELAAMIKGAVKEATARVVMDSKAVFAEASKRDKLAKQLTTFVGVFDASEMTTDEVAKYGVKKLGMKCPEGTEEVLLQGYLANRQPEQKGVFGISQVADSADKGDDAIARQIKERKNK